MASRGRPKSRQRSASARKLKRHSVYRHSTQMRSSSAVSLRRVSTAPIAQSQDNLSARNLPMSAGLAVAIAQEINADPANEGRHISPERIWTVAGAVSTFDQLMDELVIQFSVSFDPQTLLQLHDTWSSPRASMALGECSIDPDDIPQVPQMPDQHADSHRAAALAALEKDPSVSQAEVASPELRHRPSRPVPTASFSQQRPPARWRLPLALPGAILATVGIFILAWTATSQMYWIAPAIGLAIFGCGAFLNAVCVSLYLTDRYGAEDTVNALVSISAIGYVLAFAFSMFIVPMYEGVGISWATSILGFLTLVAWFGSFALLRSKS